MKASAVKSVKLQGKTKKQTKQIPSAVEAVSAIKLKGHLYWLLNEREDWQVKEIESAVLRDNSELAIDCDCPIPGEGPFVYTIVLHRQDSLLFRGQWSVGKSADRETGTCLCRVYSNGNRYAIFGSWKEDGGTQHW